MEPYVQANQDRWNELAPIHAQGEHYRTAAFRAGALKLHPIERQEMGDVSGRTMLHLQCHFGLDTLSWARLGAIPTGVDFAESAIAIARSLTDELGLNARFVHSNVYDLRENLTGEFDIVFTSWGVIGWLPELRTWGQVIAHFLRPGGVFYIVEAHPFAWVFDDDDGVTNLRTRYGYFSTEPIATDAQGSYAERDATVTHTREYGWIHSLAEITTSLIDAGLRIEYLHEFPTVAWQMFPFMTDDGDDMWILPPEHEGIPLSFSLRAIKPPE